MVLLPIFYRKLEFKMQSAECRFKTKEKGPTDHSVKPLSITPYSSIRNSEFLIRSHLPFTLKPV